MMDGGRGEGEERTEREKERSREGGRKGGRDRESKKGDIQSTNLKGSSSERVHQMCL